MPGQIIILNGAPRSGKSAIAAAIQEDFEGIWMNLGVDLFVNATPPKYRPGIGLRPGGERPDLEVVLPAMFGGLYDSVAVLSRNALNVVVDIGHHDAYSRPLGILASCASRLHELPVLLVGVRCPIEVILERRAGSQGAYLERNEDGSIPDPVLRWQEAVHIPGVYDLEVDTSVMTAKECAEAIRLRLASGSKTFALARLSGLADHRPPDPG